jgi:hypothetical protein
MDNIFRSAAAALLLFCAAIPASAQRQPMPSHPDWRSQAAIVAKMEGISVDEAVRRGHLQNFANQQIELFAQDEDYAGSWITQDRERFTVTFAFKGGQGGRSIGNPDLARVARFADVPYSQREIDAERIRLGPVLKAHGIDAAFSSSVQDNKLSLHPSDRGKLLRLIASGEVSLTEFVVVMDGPLPRPVPERVDGKHGQGAHDH